MTHEEYTLRVKEITSKTKGITLDRIKKIEALKLEFALSNSKVRIGDRVTNKDDVTIRVENIIVDKFLLKCIYEGTIVINGKLTKSTTSINQLDLK